MSNNLKVSIIPDLSTGFRKEKIEKIMSDLSIVDYWFKDGNLCIGVNAKFVKPNRQLTELESSIIEFIESNPFRIKNTDE